MVIYINYYYKIRINNIIKDDSNNKNNENLL